MPRVIQGFDQLAQALRDSPKTALPLVREAMLKSVLVVEGILKTYPPETDANKPGRWRQVKNKHSVSLRPMGYYERRRGQWYPVMREATLGPKPKKSEGRMTAKRARREHGMAGSGGVVGYKLIRSSEDLGKHWTHRVTNVGGGVVGLVGNTASYAPVVQGPREATGGVKPQARRMRAIGWPSIDDAFDQALPDIEAAFGEAVQKLLEAM
jgi:hypothetical protein